MTTKAQYKAIHDYCEEFDCTTQELMTELKENGTIDRHTTLKELGDYTTSKSYDSMLRFLAENL